jgi:hypothetical protein
MVAYTTFPGYPSCNDLPSLGVPRQQNLLAADSLTAKTARCSALWAETRCFVFMRASLRRRRLSHLDLFSQSCWCRRRPQLGDQHQDFVEHLSRYRDLGPHDPADADPAWLGQCLQARRDIHRSIVRRADVVLPPFRGSGTAPTLGAGSSSRTWNTPRAVSTERNRLHRGKNGRSSTAGRESL